MSLKNWNFFREKSEFLRDISISLKTVVRRGLPNAYFHVKTEYLCYLCSQNKNPASPA